MRLSLIQHDAITKTLFKFKLKNLTISFFSKLKSLLIFKYKLSSSFYADSYVVNVFNDSSLEVRLSCFYFFIISLSLSSQNLN